MGVRKLEDLRAFQTARAFKLEVYRLIKKSHRAWTNYKFQSQLRDAAASGEANVAEGFRRWRAAEFAHFLAYAIASMEEALRRVQDGIDRDYFEVQECSLAFDLGQVAC